MPALPQTSRGAAVVAVTVLGLVLGVLVTLASSTGGRSHGVSFVGGKPHHFGTVHHQGVHVVVWDSCVGPAKGNVPDTLKLLSLPSLYPYRFEFASGVPSDPLRGMDMWLAQHAPAAAQHSDHVVFLPSGAQATDPSVLYNVLQNLGASMRDANVAVAATLSTTGPTTTAKTIDPTSLVVVDLGKWLYDMGRPRFGPPYRSSLAVPATVGTSEVSVQGNAILQRARGSGVVSAAPAFGTQVVAAALFSGAGVVEVPRAVAQLVDLQGVRGADSEHGLDDAAIARSKQRARGDGEWEALRQTKSLEELGAVQHEVFAAGLSGAWSLDAWVEDGRPCTTLEACSDVSVPRVGAKSSVADRLAEVRGLAVARVFASQVSPQARHFLESEDVGFSGGLPEPERTRGQRRTMLAAAADGFVSFFGIVEAADPVHIVWFDARNANTLNARLMLELVALSQTREALVECLFGRSVGAWERATGQRLDEDTVVQFMASAPNVQRLQEAKESLSPMSQALYARYVETRVQEVWESKWGAVAPIAPKGDRSVWHIGYGQMALADEQSYQRARDALLRATSSFVGLDVARQGLEPLLRVPALHTQGITELVVHIAGVGDAAAVATRMSGRVVLRGVRSLRSVAVVSLAGTNTFTEELTEFGLDHCTSDACTGANWAGLLSYRSDLGF